jgi:HAE1 family hydrophobic/amphiphilic exporter-1
MFRGWDERHKQGLTLEALMTKLRASFGDIQEAFVMPIIPPAIRGLGMRGGFQLQLEDLNDIGSVELQQVTQDVVDAARAQSGLVAVNSMFRPGVPQMYVDIDRVKVKALDVPLDNVFLTLQSYLGSAYINDFNKFGRTYQVRVQADQRFRAQPRDIERLEVRNRRGEMLPLSSVATVRKSFGPQVINRYNLHPTSSVTGEPAPGTSSGQSLDLMEQIVENKLPRSVGYEWTAMAYQEKRVGGQALYVFGMAVVLVYLVLAGRRSFSSCRSACWDRSRPYRCAAWTITFTRKSASC